MGTSKGYIPPKTQEWRKAKTSVTRMITGNDTVGGIKSAVSEYAKAYSITHLNNSKVGSTVGNLLGFLFNIKENGLEDTLYKEGLGNLIGKSNEEIYLGIIDYFCEDNSTIEDSVIRECIVEIFNDNNIVDFEDMDKLDGNNFIKDFIIKYIQVNFEVAFSEKIQGLCESIEESKLKIKEVNQYIDDTIRNLYDVDKLLDINWRGKDGANFINKKCKECYELIMIFEEE
ncbi:MAG: hypothetical protein AB6733_08120 [Clostridiaceae bacterium]